MRNNEKENKTEKIKLVIWDLDDTVWNGTLSDGCVAVKQEISDLIKRLSRRGVINAVCSKNDEKMAVEKLKEIGLLDYFVYWTINWERKGNRIRDMISMLKLRPSNVLFVDDNMFNLKEAVFDVPGIQVVIADKLLCKIQEKEIVFDEKDDDALVRLDQYKTLVKRAKKKDSFSSNEEFLYNSDITVECVEDNADKLERIYEMIHRNNQLNFTKNRISMEEVRTLFLDPDVKSGCVRVKDKYGDYGIVGCYALKDKRLEQFVFSCRILNMGVEQWIYAQLGYPEVAVVQPVAANLKKDSVPGWINRESSRSDNGSRPVSGSRIMVYGSCPLRPIWAYLEPVFPQGFFAEIDPEPSICNLAVSAGETKEYTDSILSEVGVFDKNYTFERSPFTGDVDYLIISLDEALSFYKYSSGEHSFYSKKLSSRSAGKEILKNYTETPITCDDIVESFEVICDHLKDTVLLIVLNPETEFPLKGKNEDYHKRIILNQMAESLSKRRQNVRLVDIRKYTSSPMDFYDTYAGHFNRSVAYKTAQDIISIISPESKSPDALPLKNDWARVRESTVTGDGNLDLEIAIRIHNGKLSLSVMDVNDPAKLDGFTFDYDLFCSGVKECSFENTTDRSVDVNCERPGIYYGEVTVRDGKGFEQKCHSEKIDYSEYNYFLFEDTDPEKRSERFENLKHFCKENADRRATVREYICEISKLLSSGVSIADYFFKRGIYEISLLTDDEIGSVLVPILHNSGIRIRHIYSTDIKGYFNCDGGTEIMLTDDINNISVKSGENVLLAYNGRQFEKWTSAFKLRGANIHNISYVISALKTGEFFIKKVDSLKLPRVICVRSPHLHPFYTFPYTSILASEKTRKKVDRERPEPFVDPVSLIRSWKDRSVDDETITNGIRITVGQPLSCRRNIYIFGDSYVYGLGVTDAETIPSRLQGLCGDGFKVHNMSNIMESTEGDYMIRSVLNRKYAPDDIVVIFLTGWRQKEAEKIWHWLNWEECSGSDVIETLDTFPIFLEPDRQEYFLAKGSYNPTGNQILAEHLWHYLQEGKKDE